jgi:cytosine/adenosine deaminase-related metal-dependent hydrolase
MSEEYKDEDIVEMDIYDKLVEGHVCYVHCYQASAEEIENDDED